MGSALLGVAAVTLTPAAALALAPPTRAAPLAPRVSPRAFTKLPYDALDAAQPTGVLVETRISSTPFRTRLTALNAAGAKVWTLAGASVGSVPGTLPAAFAVAYDSDDANAPSSGVLEARSRSGALRFRRRFSAALVSPLCDSPGRLVWTATSAARVTRLYVRQRNGTHVLALPYRSPASQGAQGPNVAIASAKGDRVLIEITGPQGTTTPWRTFWVRVDRSGRAHIVSAAWTDWGGAAMSPDGRMAYAEAGTCLWLPFGSFKGQSAPAGECIAGDGRILLQRDSGGATPTTVWAQATALVLDWSLATLYTHSWTWQEPLPPGADASPTSLQFTPDPAFRYLAGVDFNARRLIAVNVDEGATVTVSGSYYEARPLADGRIVALTTRGTIKTLANPFAEP